MAVTEGREAVKQPSEDKLIADIRELLANGKERRTVGTMNA